jgi:hypothetical protein
LDFVTGEALGAMQGQRASLRNAVVQHFKSLIMNGVYGKPTELWEQVKDFTFMHASPEKRWSSRLLSDIMQVIFFGCGRWSIRGDVVDIATFPDAVVKLGIFCVSFGIAIRWAATHCS